MPRGPRAVAIQLSEESRAALEAMTRSRSLPNPLVRRARVVLLAAEGKANVEIGMTVGLSRSMVGMWPRRYATQGMMGLYDEPRPGGPRSIDDDRIVALIRKTLQSKPKVRRWIGARPRFHVHYTPTYSSWINQLEIWFNIVTQQAIHRGTFHSVRDLVRKIYCFVSQYNNNAEPFAWAATADSILQKIERSFQTISGTSH